MCLERLPEAKEDYEQIERTLAIKVRRFYRQGFKKGTIYVEVQVFGGTKIEKGKIDD